MREAHAIIALKPCPFCGFEAEHLYRADPMTKWKHRIVCASTTCGMEGPVEATKFDAISAWNRRSCQTGKEEPLMADYDLSIHRNPDAMAWAEFFDNTFPTCNVPKDVMVGWFANAMMAMHDHLAAQGRASTMDLGRIPADIDRIASDIVHAPHREDSDPEYAMYRAVAEAIYAERLRPFITNPDSSPTPPE